MWLKCITCWSSFTSTELLSLFMFTWISLWKVWKNCRWCEWVRWLALETFLSYFKHFLVLPYLPSAKSCLFAFMLNKEMTKVSLHTHTHTDEANGRTKFLVFWKQKKKCLHIIFAQQINFVNDVCLVKLLCLMMIHIISRLCFKKETLMTYAVFLIKLCRHEPKKKLFEWSEIVRLCSGRAFQQEGEMKCFFMYGFSLIFARARKTLFRET